LVAVAVAITIGELTRGPGPEQSPQPGTLVAAADPKAGELPPMPKADVVPPVLPPVVVSPPMPEAAVVPAAPPPMPPPPVVAPPSPPPVVPEPAPMPPSPPADPPTMTLDLSGGVTMELVRIPAGEFLMGSPKSEQDEYKRLSRKTVTDEDQHPVRISKGFYLGRYPVTQEQYQAVTGRNPSYFCASGVGKDKVQGLDTRRFPVESVSWDDAAAFCEKLSGATRRKVTLPIEAEWEYACRAGTQTAFYFGDALNGTQANCKGTEPFGTTAKGPYLGRTSRVGSYEKDYPHPWGLADMHGNVWQWCQDRYDAGYYERSPTVDPLCMDGERNYRILRGGSWYGGARDCRAAGRYWIAPLYRRLHFGFRIALHPD
jgi:formylglycine-generating enzyme required for sulfatase activity